MPKNDTYMKLLVLVALLACHASKGILQKFAGMNLDHGQSGPFSEGGLNLMPACQQTGNFFKPLFLSRFDFNHRPKFGGFGGLKMGQPPFDTE